jgi:hypothetical protein
VQDKALLRFKNARILMTSPGVEEAALVAATSAENQPAALDAAAHLKFD